MRAGTSSPSASTATRQGERRGRRQRDSIRAADAAVARTTELAETAAGVRLLAGGSTIQAAALKALRTEIHHRTLEVCGLPARTSCSCSLAPSQDLQRQAPAPSAASHLAEGRRPLTRGLNRAASQPRAGARREYFRTSGAGWTAGESSSCPTRAGRSVPPRAACASRLVPSASWRDPTVSNAREGTSMRATLPPGLVAVLANRHGVVTTALLRSLRIGGAQGRSLTRPPATRHARLLRSGHGAAHP